VGYQPRGAKFPHCNELTLVRGLPSWLVERALPFVTVYSGRQQINVLDAAPEVIAALPGMTPDRLNEFLLQRQASSENAKQLLLPEAQQFATLEGGKVFRVAVRITFDNGHTEKAEIVVVLFEDGDQPFAILSWHDKQDELSAEDRL